MTTYFEETLAALKGQKILDIRGLNTVDGEVEITFETGRLTLGHIQDCCESVRLEDFEGEPADLIGKVLVSAEETSNVESSDHWLEKWTFYSIRTTGGDLWLRWAGRSNGYYSVSVDTSWKPNKKPTQTDEEIDE
jgi:hypothetical protein